MQPHDLAYLLAGLLDAAPTHPAADHAHHAAGNASSGWTTATDASEVSMPPALMTLRPDVAPYAPATDDRDSTRAAARAAATRATARRLALTAAPVRRVSVRPHRDDARLQRPVPRTADPGGRGIHHRRAFHQPHRLPHGRALARRAARQRFDGAPTSRRIRCRPAARSSTACTSAMRASTGITRIIAKTSCRTWASTATARAVARPRFLRAGQPRRSPHARRSARRARTGSSAMACEAPTHALMGRFGNVLLVNGEPRWDTERATRRGGAVLPHQRLEHARLQRVVRRAHRHA